jgi:hypothetical protein
VADEERYDQRGDHDQKSVGLQRYCRRSVPWSGPKPSNQWAGPPLSQADGVYFTTESFMRTEAFLRGFAEVRSQDGPRFDDEDVLCDPYAYEAGRQFAVLAPSDLVILQMQEINPIAVQLLDKLVDEGAICV